MRELPGHPDQVLGGDQIFRVTPVGRFLRAWRLDELPQIFNVLRGDIRFIGPRPPLRVYVEDYPRMYSKVLQSRPGITGLATVMVHRREQRILAKCTSAKETNEAYRKYCVPLKARLDLIYQDNRSIGLDIVILVRTFSSLIPRKPEWRGRVSVSPLASMPTAKLPPMTNARQTA